jgi:GWxTD domain-containing protein
MRNLTYITILLLAVLSHSGCKSKSTLDKTSRRATRQPIIGTLYNPSTSTVLPEYRVVHQNDSISFLHVKVYTEQLLFNRANEEKAERVAIRIHTLVNEVMSRSITDSTTIEESINRATVGKVQYFSIPLKIKAGSIYMMRVYLTDVPRGSTNLQYVEVDKSGRGTPQFFQVNSARDGYPLIRPSITGSDLFYIYHTNNKDASSIHVDLYTRDTPAALPPFSPARELIFEQGPDSSWVLPYSTRKQYQLTYPGLYIVRFDTSVTEGLSLVSFGNHYPAVITPQEMLGPLVYLTTSTELQEMKEAARENTKKSVDAFWLKIAENPEVAREMVKIYYNRVKFANYYFTSHKEGWKTDRGMIYSVFGPPAKVKKSDIEEVWEYYGRQKSNVLKFVFKRTGSLYSGNHFVLQRGDEFTRPWREAVDSWRAGKIYIMDK